MESQCRLCRRSDQMDGAVLGSLVRYPLRHLRPINKNGNQGIQNMATHTQSAPVQKIVRLTAKQGKAHLLRAALATLETATAQEAGCIEFTFYQALAEEGSFVLLEHFADENAFSVHMEMPYTKAFFQAALVERVNAIDVPSLGAR